jgi:RNA polymerase sigma factor (TIGR02999 family)
MTTEDVTQLLLSLREGRREALSQLFPLVYDELRRIAGRAVGSRGADQTLGATAVVHEAYLKLFDQTRLTVNDRKHFFALAATAMRQIVVDHARRRSARKRGGDLRRVDLDAESLSREAPAEDILSLDQALQRLAVLDERLERVVVLRFFGGLSVEETAEVLEVNPRTVKRDWRKARALLYQELSGI